MKFIFPLIFFGTALLLLFTVVKPLYLDVQVLGESDSQYEDALTRSQELQNLRERLTTKYQDLSSEDVSRITNLLPDNIDNVRLILDVDDIARANRMRISGISVSVVDNNGTGGRGGSATTASQMAYEKMTLTFNTEAPYATFLMFLADLERSLRLVDISELDIKEIEGENNLSYTISLQSYWLK